MNRLYVLKAFERTRKSALRVSSSVVPSSSTSGRFWSRSNAFSSSFLREQERDELSRTTNGKERTSGETETERSVRRRKEEPQNKFLESLRRETVKNLEEHHVSTMQRRRRTLNRRRERSVCERKRFERHGERNLIAAAERNQRTARFRTDAVQRLGSWREVH